MNPNQNPGSGPQHDPRQEGAPQATYADNPYYAAHAQAAASPASGAGALPDLDANAPVLRTTDSQRLNRKALAFLAGILGLIGIMGFLVLKAAGKSDGETRKAREEAVVVPELQAPAAPPLPPAASASHPEAAEPIALATQPELPPLPPRNDAFAPPMDETAPPPPLPPSLLERRIGAMAAGEPGDRPQDAANDLYMKAMMASLQAAQGGSAQATPPAEPRTSAQAIQNPDALLARGTYIRCLLETRIVTDVPGYTSCVVTEPVYSINGRRLLLPKGSKVLGRYEGEPNGPRVAVLWDRVLTPNGIDVTMASPGIDNLGGAGHPGHYNAHWGSRISAALLISLISDAFKYAAAEEGPQTTEVTSGGIVISRPFESNTARTVERLAEQALNRAANRPATVTINQGTMVNVYVARDVDFSGVLSR